MEKRANPDDLHNEADLLLARSDDDLYSLLVSEEDRAATAFSRSGLVARGREIFRLTWQDLRAVVCTHHRKHEKTINSRVDLVVLVATPLIGHPALAGISVVTFAALVVKIGV